MTNSRVKSKTKSAIGSGLFLRISFLLALFMSVIVFPGDAPCGQATLAWDPQTTPGLAGYKIHYGTASRTYPLAANAGLQTTYTVTGLTAGVTYYFAATAYDSAGVEGPFSNEVSYTVPSSCSYVISPASASHTSAAATGSVTVTTSSGCTWTTTNSASWVTITSGASGSGNGTVGYSISANTSSGSRSAGLTIAGALFTIMQAGGASPSYTITASAGAGRSISPSGDVSVNAGASRSFTTTPASRYKAAAVAVDGTSVAAVTSHSFAKVGANHSISAVFAVTQTAYILAVTTVGSGSGTVTRSPSAPSYLAGTVVTLTATPSWGSVFSGWSGACSGTSLTCTVTMRSDTAVTATFSSRWKH